jgi:hypothetical protein
MSDVKSRLEALEQLFAVGTEPYEYHTGDVGDQRFTTKYIYLSDDMAKLEDVLGLNAMQIVKVRGTVYNWADKTSRFKRGFITVPQMRALRYVIINGKWPQKTRRDSAVYR